MPTILNSLLRTKSILVVSFLSTSTSNLSFIFQNRPHYNYFFRAGSATWTKLVLNNNNNYNKRITMVTAASADAADSVGSNYQQQCSSSSTTTTAKKSTSNNNNSLLSLQDFLIERKEQLFQQKQQQSNTTNHHNHNHFVIGNEAGDADSIISSITLAYIESVVLLDDYSTTTTIQKSKKKTPIISIPKRDLETQRPETKLLLHLAGISTNNLIYVDDEPLLNLSSKSDSSDCVVDVTLVDHNCLRNNDPKNWKVVEIVDHHHDEGEHLDTCIENRDIAFDEKNQQATAASTCTLVAERLQQKQQQAWMKKNNNDNDNNDNIHQYYYYPTDVAVLLLGTILLDSINMLPQAGKVTPRDVKAVQSILDNTKWDTMLSTKAKEILKISDNNDSSMQQQQQPNTSAFFDALQSAKFDLEFWKSLSVRDTLRLDYKQFASNGDTFGISTVMMPRNDFISSKQQNNEDIVKSIENYMIEMNIKFLGIMFSFRIDDTFHRQLILCGLPGFPLDDLVNYLMKADTDDSDAISSNQDSLRLTEINTPTGIQPRENGDRGAILRTRQYESQS